MAGIYIIYADEDRRFAEEIFGVLSGQWETWWGDYIVGPFHKAIEEEIPKADCIVPLVSTISMGKDTVIAELELARRHGIPIIPVKIDNSEPIYPFNINSNIDMQGWDGDINHSGLILLQKKISIIVPPKEKPKRPISIAGGRILLPTLFHSVSSFDTQLKPFDAVRALRVFGVSTILVSAYDLVERRDLENLVVYDPIKLIIQLKKFRKNGGFVLIDSGNYEASRLSDERWCQDNFKDALTQVPHDWVFCFDVMKPSKGSTLCTKQIIEAVRRGQEFTSAPVLPIVHTHKFKEGGYRLDTIPQIVREVSEKLTPPLIAIPERELGNGLVERVRTVKAIRKELCKLPFYQPLHLLGTGNPWSIPLLVAAGADTFDGLEWCRMVVDCDKHRLHHFQHFDFFAYQASVAASLVTREAQENPEVDFDGKVAFHNLDYYDSFILAVRKHLREGSMETFMTELIDLATVDQLKQEIPGLFI